MIHYASQSVPDTYTKSESQATKLSSSLKDKIHQLFGRPHRDSGDELLGAHTFRPAQQRKRSNEGKSSSRSNAKRKVKEIRLKVVGLTVPRSNVPAEMHVQKLSGFVM